MEQEEAVKLFHVDDFWPGLMFVELAQGCNGRIIKLAGKTEPRLNLVKQKLYPVNFAY